MTKIKITQADRKAAREYDPSLHLHSPRGSDFRYLCEAFASHREQAMIEGARIGQNVLMWLGTYRDDLSQKAIADLQSIASAALGETK